MKFTRLKVSRLADESKRLFDIENGVGGLTGFFNFLAFLAIIYFAAPIFSGKSVNDFTLRHALFLSAIVLLATNQIQLLILGQLRRKRMRMEEESKVDALTGAMSQHCFEKILEDEVRRASRYHQPLTLCLLDIDGFRSINEHFGRAHGDDILQRFTRLIRGAMRFTDVLARYGRDEFYVLLPHTDLVRSEKFISRILLIAQERLDCTFSAGVTSFRSGESKGEFFMRTGMALDQAKREGAKRIRCMIGHDDGRAVVSF